MTHSSLFLVFAAAAACIGGSTAQIYQGAEAAAAAAVAASSPETAIAPAPANDFITQTVYGFLDFTTTIANTVMVFSPESAPPGKEVGCVDGGTGEVKIGWGLCYCDFLRMRMWDLEEVKIYFSLKRFSLKVLKVNKHVIERYITFDLWMYKSKMKHSYSYFCT